MTGLLLLLLAADGGTDAPLNTTYANPDAGVYVVQSARQYDGGLLPDGWWHSRERERLLGVHIAKVETERDVAHLALMDASNVGPTWGFWSGVALGSTATAAVVTTLVLLIK